MTWLVRRDTGKWENLDDLTLDEVLAVEAVTGQPWALLNPLRSAVTAKALLALYLVRDDGMPDEDAQKQVGAMLVRDFKELFRYRDDDTLPDDWEDGLPVVDPKPVSGDDSTG